MKRFTIASVLALVALLLIVGVAYAITNGQPDEGMHPYVGMIYTPVPGTGYGLVCSGTAISETEVLTAAHCFFDDYGNFIGDYTLLTFADEFAGFQYEGIAHPHPDYPIFPGKGLKGFDTHDVAIVVVSGTLPGPYPSLPSEGLVDGLPMKQDLTVVGYGIHGWITGFGNKFNYADWDLTRYYAMVELVASNHVHADEYIKVSANPAQDKGGTCFGDSGGPTLLEDGDDITVLAVSSYVTNMNCAGVTYNNRVDLDWALDFINGGYLPLE